MRVESLESRVESQTHAFWLRSLSGPRHSTLDPRPVRRGVTLVELLITIMIITILAGLVLGVAAVAGETARQAQSRHIVERLHTLLTDYYDTYKSRRVKLRETAGSNPGIEQQINVKYPNDAAARGQALAEARMYAMRELMLMEIPDRWSDVLLQSVESFNPSTATPPVSPYYLVGRTDLSNVYWRRCRQLWGRINTISGTANTPEEIKNNQGAECLYMIITLACGDGEARSLFAENSIGDSDGDGAPEFLDGWGHPINFLRWAPGFDSQIQINAGKYGASGRGNPQWATDAAKDHDPFDVFRRDPYAFRLVPLIYSPGRNESSGLVANEDLVVWRDPGYAPLTVTFSNSAPYITNPRLDPYKPVTPSTIAYLGTSLHVADPAANPEETSSDNIHNHLMGQRQ
jgi:prepilin-type N-terminal cleavage/methylation domain-containing protein